jgi:hypothetical protein
MKQRDFLKSLLLRVFRPETREEPARFFESGIFEDFPKGNLLILQV